MHLHFGLNQMVSFKNPDGTGQLGGKVLRCDY